MNRIQDVKDGGWRMKYELNEVLNDEGRMMKDE